MGFLGALRDGADHSALSADEREMARTLPEYAARGFLSYSCVQGAPLELS